MKTAGNSVCDSAELAIKKADSLARGDRLQRLRDICKSQKTVSTRLLSEITKDIAKDDYLNSLHFRELASLLSKAEAAMSNESLHAQISLITKVLAYHHGVIGHPGMSNLIDYVAHAESSRMLEECNSV